MTKETYENIEKINKIIEQISQEQQNMNEKLKNLFNTINDDSLELDKIINAINNNNLKVERKGEWLPFEWNYHGEIDILPKGSDSEKEECYAPVYVCSVCGKRDYHYNFCPHCGARMED